MKKIKLKPTQRGFLKGTFEDRYGSQCSIQESSLATEAAIWLGIEEPNPEIMRSDAIRMGLQERMGTEKDNGWTKYLIPKEVHINTRMHLTQKQVKMLLPILTKFAETGELE